MPKQHAYGFVLTVALNTDYSSILLDFAQPFAEKTTSSVARPVFSKSAMQLAPHASARMVSFDMRPDFTMRLSLQDEHA